MIDNLLEAPAFVDLDLTLISLHPSCQLAGPGWGRQKHILLRIGGRLSEKLIVKLQMMTKLSDDMKPEFYKAQASHERLNELRGRGRETVCGYKRGKEEVTGGQVRGILGAVPDSARLQKEGRRSH